MRIDPSLNRFLNWRLNVECFQASHFGPDACHDQHDEDRPDTACNDRDDWAKQRGRVYGTILVDLERPQAVDLLPDRTAETVARDRLANMPAVSPFARLRLSKLRTAGSC